MVGKFDFRDGMLLERVVYKDTSIDCLSRLKYFGYWLCAMAYGCAWFALFFWLYIFHERVAFWLFIACWIVFAAVLVVKSAIMLHQSEMRKEMKQRKKEELLEKEKQIEKARQQKMQKEFEKNTMRGEKDNHYQLNTEIQELNP